MPFLTVSKKLSPLDYDILITQYLSHSFAIPRKFPRLPASYKWRQRRGKLWLKRCRKVLFPLLVPKSYSLR